MTRKWVLLLLILGTMQQGYAQRSADRIYRSFWQPSFQGHRLGYCLQDGLHCGRPVANAYCRMMGYAYAKQQIVAHNLGLTTFLHDPRCSGRLLCRGWRCDGFKTIRCAGFLSHHPPKPYHYRKRRFVYPRFDHFRVDYCYTGQTGCGRRAAYSFCRRLGYRRAIHFERADAIGATKAIANQKLCFGPQCQGFTLIDCAR